MKLFSPTFRVFAEIVVILASVEAGIMFLLPVIAPGAGGAITVLLDIAILISAAGPLILWRMRAAARRAGNGQPINTESSALFPARGIVLVFGVALALLTATHLVAMAKSARERDGEIKFRGFRARVLLLDERLTMSARLAAAGGDLRWEDRYRVAERELDALLRQSDALLGRLLGKDVEKARAAIAAISRYNDALIELENRCFQRLRAGDRDGATAAVMSDE